MATDVVGVNLNFVLSDSSPSFRPCLLRSSCSVRAPLQRPTIEAKKELTRRETIEISHTRIRKKLSGTPERPRLAVFRSNQHIYAQVIDDTKGFPLVSASTIPKALRDELNFSAGPMIAARARVRSDAIKKKQAVVELKDDNELEEKEDEHREEGTVEAEVSEDSKSSYPDMAAFLDEAFKDDREVQEIIEKSFDDPEEMGKRVNERVKKKKKDILQSKTGSAIPMKVSFSNFDATDSYIWMELYNSPSEKDIDIIGSVVRSWYLLGCLGAYNSLNMQLTKIPVNDRLSYNENIEDDIIPARFNNIGELEFQHNWGRFWVDLGTSDPLALDVLVNSFANVSSDYVGIKEVTFGGKDIGRWDEAITSEEDGCLSYKI